MSSPLPLLTLVFEWDWPISLMVLFKIKFTVFLNNFILHILSLSDISMQCNRDRGDKSLAKHFLFSFYEVHRTLRSRTKRSRQHVSVTFLSSFLTLSCLVLKTAIWSIHYYLYFANLKTEAQRNFTIQGLIVLAAKEYALCAVIYDLKSNDAEHWTSFRIFSEITYITSSSKLKFFGIFLRL